MEIAPQKELFLTEEFFYQKPPFEVVFFKYKQNWVANLCESSWVIANGPFYDYLIAFDYLRLQ